MADNDDDLAEFGLDKAERGTITIPDASLMNDDVMSRDEVSALTSDDFEIFVNPQRGDDSNPGTHALPIKTIEQAYKLMPATPHNNKRRVNLAAGTYPTLPLPSAGIMNALPSPNASNFLTAEEIDSLAHPDIAKRRQGATATWGFTSIGATGPTGPRGMTGPDLGKSKL